jgi:hypothetical protein
VVIATKFGFDLNPNFDPRGMKGAPGLIDYIPFEI